jgi:hypothetical protein
VTGKTTKDVRQDAEDVDATKDVQPEAEARAEEDVQAAEEEGARAEDTETRPVKRRRRVRVIEVIDDDDLDDVLDTIDAEDEAAEEVTEVEEAGKAAQPKASKTTATKPKPRAPREPVSLDQAEQRTFLGMGRVQAVVIVLLVAVLASLGIWQWRTAAGLSAREDDRREVARIASAYGDVALNYNASNYQTQLQKTQALLAGDLLERFKATTLRTLGDTFRQSPQVALTSKTDQVFIASVDERFASVTISVDVNLKTTEGVSDSPATLIRLSLAKIDGAWKVTEQYASGVNDQNKNQQGALPTTPASPGASPGATPSGSPKD